MFHNMVVVDGEELLAPRPTFKLEDDPLSTVRDVFNIYAGPMLPIGLVTGTVLRLGVMDPPSLDSISGAL